MTADSRSKLERAINSLFLLSVVCFFIALAYNHAQLIWQEFPLDYNENGMLVITSTIAQVDNPFSIQSQPARISVYPVLYNIVVAPLSNVLGNTLELHRLIVGFFILGCCAICFYLCRKESATLTESLLAAVLIYAGLLYYSTPIASPNALGLFLFLAAIAIPAVCGFSSRSLAASLVLGIAAFYTKQYFIAALGYVALHTFLTVSKKRAIVFGFLSLAVFILSLALVQYTSPYYLENTVFAVQSITATVSRNEVALSQLRQFLQPNYPLLIILVIAGTYGLFVRLSGQAGASRKPETAKKEKGALINLFDLDQPLQTQKLSYLWVCCVCSVVVIVLFIGKNPGNHLTYFFQLISPFLVIGVCALVSKMPRWRWPFRILILLTVYNCYALLPKDFSADDKNWITVRNEIAQAEDVYASTLVLGEVIKHGGQVYLNGHTRYFPFGKNKPEFLVKAEPEHTVAVVWNRHVDRIQTKIRNQEFDLVLIDTWMALPTYMADPGTDTKKLFEQHYERTDQFALPLIERRGGGKFGLEVWKPKPPL